MSRISHRLKHLATVTRIVKGAAVAGVGALTSSTIATDLPVLVEGIKAIARASVLGRIEQAQFVISWDPISGQTLQEQDLVAFGGRNFVLREILEDLEGGYFTGVLQGKRV